MHPLSSIPVFDAAAVRARLRAAAEALGSQRALAEEAGVSDAYMSDVLNGRREPTDAICVVIYMKRATIYYEEPRKGKK